MIKDSKGLINEIKAVFEKHGAFIEINDRYNGLDELDGQDIEVKSHSSTDDSLDIYIDDFEEFAQLISS